MTDQPQQMLPFHRLTFLFTDIEGSTARWENQREAMAASLVRHDALVREAIEGHGGHVIKTVPAGRCAAQPRVRERLPAALMEEPPWALAGRGRDVAADMRARIEAGLALGWQGDPRFERRQGPHGAYLVPPMVAVPGGAYPIGEDEPMFDNKLVRYRLTIALISCGR